MSYIALYRKYRPHKFSDVVNQEHIKKTLINALVLNKVAHAYLFSGPRGVGKTTIGRLLAKATNCTELSKKTGEACGKCSNCKEVSNDKSIDIIEIDAASNRGIDEIRELREKIKYMPSKLKFRVFIIDEVHMLTIEAFNALLKTLEEPPAHVIFILATTEPQKVPATILSRCQRFDFKKINNEELVKHLTIIANKEKMNITPEALNMIAQNSDGSSRDSLSLLGQIQSAFNKNNIKEEDIIDLLGLASNNLIIDLAYEIFNDNIKNSLDQINDLIMRGYDPLLLMDSLVEFLRNVLIYKNTSNKNIFSMYQEQKDKIKNIAIENDNKNLLTLISYLIESKNIQKYSSIPQLPLEIAVIKYINPSDEEKINSNDESEEIIKNNKNIPIQEKKLEKKETQTVDNDLASNSQNNNIDVDFKTIDAKWADIVEKIVSTNYSLGLTLRSSKLLKVSGDSLILECDYSFHKDCIENNKNREVVENVINEKIGSPISIKCIVGKNKPKLNEDDREVKDEDVDSSENLLNTALDIMGGKVTK